MDRQEQERLREVLLTSQKPSDYFEKLREDGELEKDYPDLYHLIGVEQNPEYHPEGDVFTHTMMVLDQAAKLRDKAHDPLAFMLAALYHDTGKREATKMDRGKLRSIGHENISAKKTDAFLKGTDFEPQRREAVNLTKLHMRPNMLAKAGSRMRATDKLFSEALDPEDLILLAEADNQGRGGVGDYTPTREFLHKRLDHFKNREVTKS